MAKLKVENTIFPREWSMNYGGKLFTFQQPQVMGIVNCTPDSFFSQSRKSNFEAQKLEIDKHVSAGATWLDLGAYSSRPGAEDISVKEEIERLSAALNYIREYHPNVLLSVDTFRSEVAAYVLEQGPAVINDISGGLMDPEMFTTIGKHHAPLILMHMRGTPQTMSQRSNYSQLFTEVIHELETQVKKALDAGIVDVIIDPGFGFAKTTAQNFELLNQLDLFQVLEKPMLIGVSRKSMIYKTLEISPEEALNGTTVLNSLAIQKGAHILRVHDVKEAVETIRLLATLQGE